MKKLKISYQNRRAFSDSPIYVDTIETDKEIHEITVEYGMGGYYVLNCEELDN